MKIRTALLLVVIPSAFVATSCAPSATGDGRAADASAIQALDEQWTATAARNDLDGTVAFYADDAVLLPPNAPIATDRKSIGESWAGLLGPNTAVSWKVSKVEVAKSGELGYLYGTYPTALALALATGDRDRREIAPQPGRAQHIDHRRSQSRPIHRHRALSR